MNKGSDFEKLMKVVKANGQKMDSLNQKFSDIKRDYTELKKKVENNTVILNETQQYLQNSSMRIYGLEVTNVQKKSVIQLLQHVHQVVFEPILQAAVETGEIARVPEADVLLEYGHCLPAQKPLRNASHSSPAPEPILVRFHSRVYRSLIFRFKKAHLKILNDKNNHKIFVTEHLTSANYAKLRSLQEDEEIEKVWTLNGRIKFTKKLDPETVLTVRNPFE